MSREPREKNLSEWNDFIRMFPVVGESYMQELRIEYEKKKHVYWRDCHRTLIKRTTSNDLHCLT